MVNVDLVVNPLEQFIPSQPIIPAIDLTVDAVSVAQLDVEELPNDSSPVPDTSTQPEKAVAIEESVLEVAPESTSEIR